MAKASSFSITKLSTTHKLFIVLFVLVIGAAAVWFFWKPSAANSPGETPTKPKIVKYYQFYGQSLSVGREGTPIISKSQPNPDNVFGPSGGPREEFEALAPLVEVEKGKMGETPVSAMANGYFMNFVEDKDNTIVISNTAGVGGQTVEVLTETHFGQFEKRARRVKELVKAKFSNNQFFMPAVFWIQGEADRDNTKEKYMSQFRTLATKIQGVAKDLTGYNTSIISYQTAGSSGTGGVVQKAQLALHEEGVLSIATPIYFLEFSSDETHLQARSSQILGAYMARAAKYTDKGERPPLLKPLAARKVGDKVVNITFDIPTKPLQIKSKNGFTLVDGSTGKNIDIKSAEVSSSGDEVVVTASSPIETTSVLVRYALTNNAGGNRGEGSLTDSSPDVIELGVTGESVRLLNYAPHFELQVN